MATHKISTTWKGNMQFESSNPGGSLQIDVAEDLGGNSNGLRPKALMLSALAGCSGLDVASLIKKMRLEVSDFNIETEGFLTDTEPAVYEKVIVSYNFSGNNLNEEKLAHAVDLSVEKYCGVMHMFRSFAEIEIKINFNK
ncbi:OsmC family peroxiredoxin [Paenimyroides tangerinum]|uniref:OsmC family peroxiredoxin n=1 Tax=Paenimyroides tangerinum TaxID=2488728 RepID=A0A3P3WDG0_9FLAO|nr:OsmC family protein [Paenimyroides tangerinum]RRJ92438.1 OsmC family peroxiredoxin [Paenimyroides tangerinum]